MTTQKDPEITSFYAQNEFTTTDRKISFGGGGTKTKKLKTSGATPPIGQMSGNPLGSG